jgi:hypothetical protein
MRLIVLGGAGDMGSRAVARVAGAEYQVGLDLLAELLAKGALHADLGQHAEALRLQCCPDPVDHLSRAAAGSARMCAWKAYPSC